MGTKIKYCVDCKYSKPYGCVHPYAFECNHASLWTPEWFPAWIDREEEDLEDEQYENQ